jgi:hypothetical protein
VIPLYRRLILCGSVIARSPLSERRADRPWDYGVRPLPEVLLLDDRSVTKVGVQIRPVGALVAALAARPLFQLVSLAPGSHTEEDGLPVSLGAVILGRRSPMIS